MVIVLKRHQWRKSSGKFDQHNLVWSVVSVTLEGLGELLPSSLVVPYREVVWEGSRRLFPSTCDLVLWVVSVLVTNEELLIETLGHLGIGGSLSGNGLGGRGVD